MFASLRRVFSDETPGVRPKIIGIYVLLIVVNLLLWGAALYTSTLFPAFLAFAVAAYLLGLRHAVDADHIAAIDNVTRKLMQENKRPVGVGFFFSLGHSTVVVLIAMLVGLGAKAISAGISDETLRWRRRWPDRHERLGVLPAGDGDHQHRHSGPDRARLSPGDARRRL